MVHVMCRYVTMHTAQFNRFDSMSVTNKSDFQNISLCTVDPATISWVTCKSPTILKWCCWGAAVTSIKYSIERTYEQILDIASVHYTSFRWQGACFMHNLLSHQSNWSDKYKYDRFGPYLPFPWPYVPWPMNHVTSITVNEVTSIKN